VSETYTFRPPRRLGLALHMTAGLLLAAGGAAALYQATRAQFGATFLLYLLPVGLALALIPYLGYRAYALWGATYTITRDGLYLHWGLRAEDLPMDQVLGVRLEIDLTEPLPRPWPWWPGSVLGQRRLRDGRPIEFLAARAHKLALINTPYKVYAISPANLNDFLQAFQRQTELGSLSPIPAHSVYPTFLLARFWGDPPARLLLLGATLLSIGLLTWISLAIPGRAQINLRPWELGGTQDIVPAVRLLLLPVINTAFYLADLLGGLFFYRKPETQPLAYLLWASSILTTLLFLIATFIILRGN
jgi:hypothetical protein